MLFGAVGWSVAFRAWAVWKIQPLRLKIPRINSRRSQIIGYIFN